MSYPDPFDRTYLEEEFDVSPDYSLSTFFDTDTFFDKPITSVEASTGYEPKPARHTFNPTLPATGIATSNPPAFRHTFDPTSLGQLEQYPTNFPLDPTSIALIEPVAFSPSTQPTSRTPSLCSDAYQQGQSPSASPRAMKRETPASPTPEQDTSSKRPLRKRGRPRLDRSATEERSVESSSSAKGPRTRRLPHNQVERKYREGLNSELERLRRTVPTLPQNDDAGSMGQPKPSKAMVLAGAIEYIRRIERERDALKLEVERLKEGRGKAQSQEYVRDADAKSWMADDQSLDEFLMSA